MSRMRELETRLQSLADMTSIIRAMRNLALLESQKLGHRVAAQRQAIDQIQLVAADFLSWFPQAFGERIGATPLYLLIGSERGFCGDFNEAVIAAFVHHLEQRQALRPLVLLVGTRLSSPYPNALPPPLVVPGPTVAEDVPTAMSQVAARLQTLQSEDERFCLLDMILIHHTPSAGHGSRLEHQQPFHALGRRELHHAFPPRLTLPPLTFAAELIEHYLWAILHDVLYGSLLAESERRFSHMEQAQQRLDGMLADLATTRNAIRQEEITNEIEMIVLNAEFLRKRDR